ncbi:MAG TPA: tyrosine--tRNA ligase [Gemmatimonadales bacterium]|jgi:tyrosyl-tRNA synthetase
MTPTTGLLDELKWRGLLHDATPGMGARLAKGPITGYVGFDPTAPSLQVGNLVPVMLLAHLQRGGGKPIVLMGGGTGMIGDPSGKRAERPLMDIAKIDEHVEQQRHQFEKFFAFGRGSTDAAMLDNAAWLRPLNLVAFLRDIGKHFTLSYMLQKESVKARMEEGISYTEFSYMLLQSYDFLHLFRTQRCELQMGGSDQWGNITAGAELIRRVEGGEAHGICAPLITTSSGAKFGKSEGEAVWLDPAMTSPYAFYNFWVNADDRDVAKYLAMFTFKPKADIDALMAEHQKDGGARIPHHALALDVTTRVHGAETADQAQRDARARFGGTGGNSNSADATPKEQFAAILRNHEVVQVQWDREAPPKFEDLFLATNLVSSKGDAKRLIAGGGLRVKFWNGEVKYGEVVPRDAVLIVDGRPYMVLQRGKKQDAIVELLGLSIK